MRQMLAMRRFFAAAFLWAALNAAPLFAIPSLKEGQFLRDAEIEDILKGYIHPLFKEARLDPNDLHMYLLNTSVVNAAATLGNTILINTGFLLSAKNAEEVIGVLAHETAHLEGGHVMRINQRIDDITLPMIVGVLAGVGLGAAASPDAGMALAMGTLHLGERSLLKFSRVHEGAADAGAIRYLNQLKWPVHGLTTFLDRLNKNELLGGEPMDPYAITHPLSHDRVDFFRHETEVKAGQNLALPAQFHEDFKRLQTKLIAFTKPVGQVLLTYKGESEMDRYARAIAHYRRSDFNEALKGIDGLLKDHPENPFYTELKAQMLFDQGKIKDAIPLYKKVIEARPDLTLVRILYAQALIESGDGALLNEAKGELMRAKTEEKDEPMVWRLLSVVHGKQNELGLSALSLAEMHTSIGDDEKGLEQAKRAQKLLASDPKNLRRADELVELLKRNIEKARGWLG